jgi:hypothetical protein
MASQIYTWKRFWCPRTGRMSLTDGGYLDDPGAEWGRFSNPDVVPFEAIAGFPCLGLLGELGEPGIGKTRSMQAQREAIDRSDKINLAVRDDRGHSAMPRERQESI